MVAWRGMIRTGMALQRAAYRDAVRREKAVLRQQQLQRAADVVDAYDRLVARLTGAHRECSAPIDWDAMRYSVAPPPPPERHDSWTSRAERALAGYAPSLLDRVLRRVDARRRGLAQDLDDARRRDAGVHADAIAAYQTALEEWEEAHDLADRMLHRDPVAMRDVFAEGQPLLGLQELGSSFSVTFKPEGRLEVEMTVNANAVLPAEVYTLTQTGKLSSRKMPVAKRNELYQDYVASAALRAGRELFALLTVDMILVTAVAELLNSRTGHVEPQAILSVILTRRGMNQLSFDSIDPSDALSNFVHRMAFRRSAGMSAVEPLRWSDLSEREAPPSPARMTPTLRRLPPEEPRSR